jgi:hypothetical protein
MAMNVEQEIRELKAQLAAAVKRIAELEGSFGYISGQLRELQIFLHNNIDSRLTSLETEMRDGFAAVRSEMRGGFDKLGGDLNRLPDIIANVVGDALRSRD